MKKKYKIISVIIVLIAAGYWFFNSVRVCGFASTPAKNVFTGYCREFPNTCLPIWYTQDIKCDEKFGRVVPAPGQEDISGWKTYRNEKYGFELKLPANLVEDGDMRFVLKRAEQYTSGIQINVMPDTSELEFNERVKECKKLNIGNTIGYRCAPSNGLPGEPFYEIFQNGIEIWITGFFNDNAILSQILSTFKFINP